MLIRMLMVYDLLLAKHGVLFLDQSYSIDTDTSLHYLLEEEMILRDAVKIATYHKLRMRSIVKYH